MLALFAALVVSQGIGNPTSPSSEYDRVYYNDVTVAALATRTPTVGYPDLIAFPSTAQTKTLCFDPDSKEEIFFNMQLPHSYKVGTPLDAHIHWAPTSTHTGTVEWVLDYSITAINGTVTAATPLDDKFAGSGTTNKHQYADLGDITCAACGISSILIGHLYRDATDAVNDTYTGDACLLAIDFHFQQDMPGSVSETSK